MIKKHISFDSASPGQVIQGVVYQPDGQAKGLVQIVHGYAEHIGRYDRLMTLLTNQGFVVFGDDHLGHGLTAGSPENLVDVGSYQAMDYMLADEQELNRKMREQFGQDLPCIILGHSMGSLLLRGLLGRYPDICDKAIIMGTGNMGPLLLKIFGWVLWPYERLRPGSYRSGLINFLGIGLNNMPFKGEKNPIAWISKNPDNLASYRADPLCGKLGSLHTFHMLQRLMSLIRQKSHLAKMNKDLPVFFMAGQEDAFGDFGKGPATVLQMFEAAGMKGASLKLYPSMRHEILNEKDSDQVYRDILDFIDQD